jgi:hypothetical protein
MLNRSSFIVCILAVLVIALPAVSAQNTIEYKLNINNTDHYVYVPGEAVIDTSSGPATNSYSNPPHFYIASYLLGSSTLLSGLVASQGQNLYYESGSGYHTIGIQQDLQNSRVLLTFTQGEWQDIERVIPLVETGKFLMELSPAFGFPSTGALYPVTIMLRYPGIDLTGDLTTGKGSMSLAIENRGVVDGNLTINIEKS